MLEKEASLSYSKKDFTSALPAYRQLLAKDQLNPDFNFRYGHCLYEVANQNDAAKYFDLIIANQLPCDPLVYYYRGRIFQHQYFFQKAISAYQQYEKLSANQKDTYPITELIKQCERGVLELKNFQTLPFLSTKEVERNKFYTQYPFADEGYSIYEAAEVLPKYNAKKGNVPIYCYRRAMKYRILALDDGSGQLDLYIQKKDAANNWAKLIKIEGEVNSSKNEAFGFYDEESQTLYFSSETNSIGGYDIFKAQLDLQTGKSSTLERLPYPYASPDDDLLFVMDRTRGQVYFSSNRAGQAGRCEIYSLALDQEKQTPFVFAGTFSNQNDNKQLKASLSFTDLNTETQFGPFLSDDNGAYLIVLPEKGSFRLSIQLEGASKAYETTFVIPTLKENEQLKQVVRYELNEYGREKYTVINSIIPADLEKQVDLLAQAQLKWQAKEIKQVQFKSTAPSISERSPLLSQFAWVDSDTAALVNQLTDTLLAAEVSLENQVRLTEVLRKDFELKLAERERLISSGDVEALDQISQELAFIQTWLNINQAANIPNIEILGKIQQTNEKIAAWQHAGQKDSILNYLESVGGELSKYLQIADFDGESALQIEQYKAQMALQEQAKALQLEKQNRLKIQDQLKVQEKNLALQSKKEQEATQKRIDQLKQQLALSDLTIDILSSKLQEQEVYVATFEQATQKEIYLSQSEQQNLPDIDLSMSMEELLSQYAQQEVLIKSIKEELNPIAEKKGAQLAQEASISNSEKVNKEGSNPISEKKEEQLAQEASISNSEKVNKEGSTINSKKKEEQLAQEASISNSEKVNKEGSNPISEKKAEQLVQEASISKAENVNKEGSNPNSEKKEEQLAQEASISNSEQVNKEGSTINAEKKEEQLTQEESNSNSEKVNKEGSTINSEKKEEQLAQEASISNSEQINKEGSNPISEKKEEQLAQEEISLNSENQAKEELITNSEKVNKEGSNPISEKKEEQLAQEASISNSEQINKEGSNPISEKKEEQLAQEETISNSEQVNQGGSTINSEKKEEQLAQEETISNSEKRANTNIETIQKLAAVSRQLNEEEGQLIETDIPSLSISAQELGELAQAIELPKASKLTETELASEQWLAYMKYLEARDTMERYKEQISNLNEQIKNLEVSYLETPTDEVQQALLEKAEAQQVAIEQLKNTQQSLLKQPLQAEFEALFEMGYLPPYELAVNKESATSESGYNPLPEGQMASFKVAQQAPGSSIPIGVPCAQGLVFRVQVGAFRKPIPAGKFTEFSPVDGRVLANGLTVVMAGYFRSSTDAINQRNVIRRLGYADAFVVAYNGCERLNYAAAVQLEGSNKGTNTQQVRKSVFETPGEGLYYTVQVGVYNRPLLSEKQLGLPELIEAQTAKGQYRYASGRFAQLAAAKERQRLAVQKGITDAFIVAYYQGKRISLAEAKTLMAQGVQMDTQTTKPKDLTPKPSALSLQTVPVLPAKKALQAAPTFVRYEQTCSDCLARLAALNRAGIFIYQTENGILSSAQIKTDELTALQRYLLRGMKINTQTLNGPFKTLTIDEGQMNGAQMDWLLRQGSPYMFTQASKESILISVEIK
ncbi:MAG: hypothetical protein RL164_1782 [Bacteroidota bacterium]